MTDWRNLEPESKEARRRRVTPEDIRHLEHRAHHWADTAEAPHHRHSMHAQATQLFELYLDFLTLGVLGLDFPRWFQRLTGIHRATIQRYIQAGEALDCGISRNRNQAGLIAELKDRARQPGPDLNWDDD